MRKEWVVTFRTTAEAVNSLKRKKVLNIYSVIVKHIIITHFFIREKISEGMFDIQQISTENQVAVFMTKPLAKLRLKFVCEQMGVQ